MEMNLRPQSTLAVGPKLVFDPTIFRFSVHPLIVRVDPPSNENSGDETDPEDHEARIQSSWHHRARLGDEDQNRYDDFQDTDFDALQKKYDAMSQEPESDGAVVVF